MRRALIDTSAIYAIADRADKYHAFAQSFAARWLKAGGDFVLLDWIFIETMTLIKRSLGGQAALHVGRELRRNPTYHWIPTSPDEEREVWAAFQKYDDKDWSYADCSLLVMSRRLKIPQVFSFDSHFRQMPGVTRLPE